MTARWRLALRVLTSLGLLVLLACLLDPAEIADQVRRIDPSWLAVGLALCVLQMLAAAARWRLTAIAIGVPLSRRRAIYDYYLAGLANQLLPGGVAGDAARAVRHARSSGRTGLAVRAVVLERASGQLVLLTITALLLITTPLGRTIAGTADKALGPALPAAAALGALALVVLLRRRPDWLQALWTDARRALLSRRYGPRQLLLSLVVFGTLCGAFASAGRMLGVEVGGADLLVLAPLVLLAMLIPLSVGGWGVRESAAAGLFALAGYAPETGVAVSIAYGLVTLLATLPGALVPLLEPDERSTAS
ncbi:flippase-like domain-containing protein [Wenzhouxiangella sp. XN79A]|uniref:lysylphosphatidylglycerol synthase transmembrane domain-containing protein n=1 Tax=Wenzhouxiangella sp. XN79A TaxID=2724193 RepID=UPI00144ABA1E|nr:lysylphosphatidylglycerol synthase transmembrane domain-containing protein [Wenzhouxiangella sp. XN79A]NKI33979.1 flippase-like domain-containing protein [Wenzhouxiangella sp. XN79A]